MSITADNCLTRPSLAPLLLGLTLAVFCWACDQDPFGPAVDEHGIPAHNIEAAPLEHEDMLGQWDWVSRQVYGNEIDERRSMAGNSYTISIKETDIHDIAEKHLDITYELGEGDTIVTIKLRGHFVGNDDILRGYHAGYAAILNERLILVFTKAEDLEEVHPETKKYMVSWIEKSQKAFSRPKR